MAPRNKIPKDKLLSNWIRIRVSENEKQEIKDFCKSKNITITKFIRNLIKNAIKQSKK
ncbi:hypothetical protein [Spiroplasma endosymbiont of Villa modesta]|uniref:hypothetical protein n=1 Tax=Spiroplasma endosymbiont of Villa modesta TaxID=3066293 RepID=UPI00313CCB91